MTGLGLSQKRCIDFDHMITLYCQSSGYCIESCFLSYHLNSSQLQVNCYVLPINVQRLNELSFVVNLSKIQEPPE
jgi:hypothetical protein